MSGELTIGSWVLVRGDCTMHCMVNSSDEVEVTFGSGSAVFDFLFSAKPLRKFMDLSLQALKEMDEMRSREGPAEFDAHTR